MKIETTKDYSIFKRVKGNRQVDSHHVNRLKKSIAERPDLVNASPIIVNDKMEVLDGQHRLEALKALGLPVSYFNAGNFGLNTVAVINSRTRVWKPIDYARSYAETGHVEYQKYLKISEEFPKLPHMGLLNIAYNANLASTAALGQGNASVAFKNGNFVLLNEVETRQSIKELDAISQLFPAAWTQPFISAYMKISRADEFVFERFIDRVKMSQGSTEIYFERGSTVDEYMRQIERIYNFQVRGEGNRVRLF